MKHFDAKPLIRQINADADLSVHIAPQTISDRVAFAFVKFLRFFAETERRLAFRGPTRRVACRLRMPARAAVRVSGPRVVRR